MFIDGLLSGSVVAKEYTGTETGGGGGIGVCKVFAMIIDVAMRDSRSR